MQRFDLIQQMIFSTEIRQHTEVQTDPLLRRVGNLLSTMDHLRSGSGRGADLIILIKQALLSCDMQSAERLRVPLAVGWPDEQAWRRFGLEVSSAGIESLFLGAQQWHPHWLDEGAGDAAIDAIRRSPRRIDRDVPADPLIESKLQLHSYRSSSQRAAVQMAFTMPKGSTSLIVLPTGSGKSLVFQSPSFSVAFQEGLTVVVVPTVALAKDQDLRFRALHMNPHAVNGAFAYHGGMSEEEKLAVKKDIVAGKVRILFTSPEAVVTSLRRPLFAAAESGLLNYFVVDEAHMISQWGDSFRPEFQMLAGMRDSLRNACPEGRQFRTLLLTATMTADCYETLASFFGVGDFRVIGDASLRSEIAFLIRNANSEAARVSYIEDALKELPRPLILYTTKREDADAWFHRIRGMGFERNRLVRGGDLSDEAGETVLQEWNSGEIDIIVATSAFGLGVDQSEVRSVIHACLPESIDRFYQEVGRSGRDGRAAVSLLVTAPDDARIASDLATQARIGIDRGFERWQEMWIHGEDGPNGTYIVSLDRKPNDIDYSGSRNAAWNLRTLVLMRRARLIEFCPHLPPTLERGTDETDEQFVQRQGKTLRKFSREISVRLLDPGHADFGTWEKLVASVRSSLRESEIRLLERTRELLHLGRPLNEIFHETYSMPNLGLAPDYFNGNCPITRHRSQVEYDPGFSSECLISPPLMQRLNEAFTTLLASCRDEAGRYWILVEPIPTQSLRRRSALRRIGDFIGLCVSAGTDVLGLPPSLKQTLDWDSLNGRSLSGFVSVTNVGEELHSSLSLPTLSYLSEETVDLGIIGVVMSMAIPESIILFTSSARDPRHACRWLVDIVPHLPIGSAISRLQL